jgi:UDP-glucose 4-epimerase
MKNKIFIAGAAGMVPSWMADYYVEKHPEMKVYGADDFSGSYYENVNPDIDFTEMDLRVYSDVKDYFKENFSDGELDTVVIGSASAQEIRSYFSPVYNASVNDDTAKNVITCAVECGVRRIVFFSSMARYGNGMIIDGNGDIKLMQPVPFREYYIPAPGDPYACSKVYIETFIKALAKVHGFEYTIIVPHNCFSPRQYVDPYRNFIAIWMNLILMGKDCYIYGDGRSQRAISWVHDFNPVICEAAFSPAAKNQMFNLGGDEQHTINEWYDMVCRVTGHDSPAIHIAGRPGEVKDAFCTHRKAEKFLGFKNTVNVEDALAEMWEHFQKKGVRPFKYINEFEINSEKIPETWSKRLF